MKEENVQLIDVTEQVIERPSKKHYLSCNTLKTEVRITSDGSQKEDDSVPIRIRADSEISKELIIEML